MIKRSIRCSAKRVSVHPEVGSPPLRIPPGFWQCSSKPERQTFSVQEGPAYRVRGVLVDTLATQ